MAASQCSRAALGLIGIEVMLRQQTLDIDGVHKIMEGFYAFQILSAAVKFDLFSLLRRALTREEIIAELGIAEQPARILLLGCVSLGLIHKQGERYRCSDAAALMLSRESPWDQRSLVSFSHEIAYRAMWWFYESLRANTNVGLGEVAGTAPTLYGRLAANPEAQRAFDDMMTTVTKLVAKRLVESIDFSKGGRLIDIGGGTATNAIALARRWPTLSIDILELPSVVASANRAVEDAGLGERIRTVGADCFAADFPNCSHVLFAHFLEIWSAEQIKSLLAKAHRALPGGGRIYLINLVQQDDETGPTTAAIVSAYFLTLASGVGMAYTCREYEDWLRDAGFEPLSRTLLTPAHGLIVGERR
jgi:ubiquinone/menaquinone biosynthesis C-methylase UbiE